MKKAWRYHRNGVKNSFCWSAMLVAGLTYLLVDHHIRSSHSVHRVNGYNGETFNAMLWSSAFTIRTDNCRIDGAWGLVIVNH